ncbi:MAG: ABC transporter permease [Treponema sp.]|jgi:ribose/xylose/arabinose/galactoside ABC-type transport system permease subunit|nr:ABC transporter permease [Treponema sp.]
MGIKRKNLDGVMERLGLIVSLVLLVIIFSSVSRFFLTWDNISNMLLSIALLGITASGMTIVIICGGVDLSIGSNIALTGVIVGSILHGGQPQWVGILAGLGVGILIGILNGASISIFNITPLIATLASMIIVKGAAFLYSGGISFGIYNTVPVFPDFGFWGRGNIFNIPTPVILLFIVMAITFFILSKTVFGRELYAVGGNEEAAKVSGIKTTKIKALTYLISGGLGAFAGIILASRLTAGVPTAGTGYEMNAVAAVVLGGASLNGGKGKIENTLLAVLVLGVLSNGFVLMGFSTFLQDVARGIILLLSVGIDEARNRGRTK